MKRLAIYLFTNLCVQILFAQTDSLQSIPDTINQRIFLIGDAGEMPGSTHPVIDWLKKNVDWNDERNSVLFLGDNIYPLGLPMEGDPTFPHSKAILDDQISLVKGKKARAYFIPGNHDWRNGKLGGCEHLFPFTAIHPSLYIPLPILGSIYPVARGVFGNVQDIPHPLYKTMTNTIEDVMRKHPYSIAVAGHDHGLQFILRN